MAKKTRKSVKKSVEVTAIEKKAYEAPTIELLSSSSDKVMDCLTAIGLSEAEAMRLKGALPILPLDGELVALSHRFVERHPAGWNHDQWISFVAELGTKGYYIGADQAKYFWAHRMIGALVETIRECGSANEERIARAA